MNQKPNIYFLHANGFPSSVYQKFLSCLANDFTVSSLEMLGHNAKYPVDKNIKSLINEVIDDVENRYQKPVLGLGHSVGGVLLYLAAKKRPDLFSGIIMMDSLIVSGLEAMMFAVTKHMNIYHFFGPAALSKGRRSIWSDRQAAIDYFSGKKLFAKFDSDCLIDYVDLGMNTLETGEKQLKFDPEIEVAIFSRYPHNLGRGGWPLKIPAAFLYGADSNVISPRHVNCMKNKAGIAAKAVPGSHMFPLEKPKETAAIVMQTIESLSYAS